MKSDLAERMRQAAETVEEASALYGYRVPEAVNWSAEMLRREAAHVAAESPQ